MIVLGLAVAAPARQALRTAELLRAEVLRPVERDEHPVTEPLKGAQPTVPARVPGRGVAGVDKWPAGATIRGRAQAGHLSTAGVARAGGHRRSPAMVRVASLSPQQGDDDDRREDGAAGADREERRYRP